MRCRGADFSFDSVFPLYPYSGIPREAVIACKAGKRFSLTRFFAEQIARVVDAQFPGRVVVPVPPRPGKIRKQGWDQVDLLAGWLIRLNGITVHRTLVRNPGGVEQKSLNLVGRSMNVKGRFAVTRGIAVPLYPLLLDDVMTTGATLSECAAALKCAGARRVDAIVIAAD